MARPARRPVVVLAALALVPALALGGLVVFARAQSPAESIAPPESSVPVTLPAALATPLLSARRAPDALADDRRRDLLLGSAAALAGSLDGSSCLVLGLDDRVVVNHNVDQPLIPASNVKIITAAVALEVLGPGHTFTTTVVGPTPVDGVIDGDVYVVGGGDPVLSERWYTEAAAGRKRPPFHVTDVNLLADALAAAGVTRISGRVLGDGSRYDDERFPPGWSDDIIASPDGAPVGALVINDSYTSSGARGSEPTASAAATFVALLAERGIEVDDGSGVAVAPAGQAVLASITSAPLTSILQEMLTTSDNLTAEMLVKEIGFVASQQGSRASGLSVFLDRLTEWGVATAGVVFTDGSGLSRDNQLTCAALAAVLIRGSATDPLGAGLARGGQAGSTLVDSFTGAGLADVLQGKTGTLSEVKSLSGYFMVGADEVEFVLILNGASAADHQARWDQLAAVLVATASAPAADALAPAA
ncbi:MAG: D-alanyl-D-alanine carboxypeptidase/D-alanyl-D-alanine-endopeptidase [Actinomycetota bacterium]|nr:D-alanyl-D-alanine carboxypeptidase/D-alanyl-D-alanine-endopeptidase [Actinomycetota bacterium]